MSDTIPNVDSDLSKNNSQADREKLEFRLLESDARLQEHRNREAGQRYWLRWIAAVVGVVVIVLMVALLSHLTHKVFWGPVLLVNRAFSVAMIVAPITSITAITVALFVGAFRRFEEKDVETVGSGVAAGMNLYRGG